MHLLCAGTTFAVLETGNLRCAKILDVSDSSKWLIKLRIEGMTLCLLYVCIHIDVYSYTHKDKN